MSLTSRHFISRHVLGAVVAATVVLPLPVAAAETVPATLPGGATSLQETFSDWQVGCVVQGAVKRCAVTQEQVNQQSRQRVLAAELTLAGDKLDGVLLMPFGLALDKGVALQIDDQPSTSTLKFRTCVPGGCLVPLNFDGKTVAALRVGAVLKLRAAADGGQEQLYTISLKGFAPALDRIAVLAK
jgi:invasion protein IalB